MPKILIIDDEQIVRVGLTTMINWHEHGYTLLTPAKNSFEALDILKQYKPEIIITDLDIPGMHGLDLIALITKDYPESKIIVLSNHGDFDLVHQAMSLGVFDFILKITMTPDKLLDTVNKAASTLPPTPEIVQKDLYLPEYLLSICKNHMHYDNLLNEYHFNLGFNHFLYITLDTSTLLQEKKNIPSYSFLKDALIHFALETFHKHATPYVVCVDNTHFLLVLSAHQLDPDALSTKCTQLIEHIELYSHLTLCTVLSAPFQNSETLYNHFKTCETTLEMYFYYPHAKILHQFNTLPLHDLTQILTLEIQNQIRYSLLDFNFSLTRLLFKQLFNQIEEQKVYPNKITLDLTDFIRSLLNYFHYPQDEACVKALLALSQAPHIEFYKETFDSLISKLYEFILPLKSRKYRPEVCEIMTYINSHLSSKLTLNMIANHINMNESYISHLFKTETGMSLMTYINSVKMQQAKELLSNPSYRIKDISELLGFENQFYFNKIFKKTYGVSPSSFQKSLKNSAV